MLKVVVGYPSYEDELVVIQRVNGQPVDLRQLITTEQLVGMQKQVRDIYADARVIAYAATLVDATRYPERHGLEQFARAILYGGSPRASINLIAGARALAYIRGRDYLLPHDVASLVPDVLRHRLVISYEGLAAGITPDVIVETLLKRYPPPRMDLGDRTKL